MSYRVRLEMFEGPLDLLLYLIQVNEIDIYDIPIATITEEYLECLSRMQELDLEVAGEFLVLAATLIHIKSKMLIPAEEADGEQAPESLEVEHAWFHKNFVIFKFASVDSISAAQGLRGSEVQVEESPALPAHTYFVSDLIGCRVVDLASGAELGRVRELVATGGTDLLSVRDAAGRELLIPFAQEICRRIVPDDKLIEVHLPEGLADLNP